MNKKSALFSQTLVKLGISFYETKLYQALLAEGSLSAKEVAGRVGVLPNAAYRLLEKLIEKGLVSATDKYPRIYRAVSPSIAFDIFTKRKILEIEKLRESAIKELINKKPKTQETKINLIISRFEIFMAYVEMAKEAKREILIISIGEAVPDEILLANRDAIEKGVQIRMIAHKYDQENKNLLKAWQKMGWEIRHYADWGFHLVVFDGKKSVLAINNPKDTRERIGMQIFSEGLSKAFRDYFYFLWEKATEIKV